MPDYSSYFLSSDRFLLLKIFVDDSDELKHLYLQAAEKHNNKIMNSPDFIDAGFDLYVPPTPNDNSGRKYFNSNQVNKLDFKITCSAQMILENGKTFNSGYYMYPRSSLSKTPLRLANSVGIIDAGYRGHLIGMFDVEKYDNNNFYCKDFDRYLQICAPGLVPIRVVIVDTLEELGEKTERGDGGFGSTGR